MSRTKQEIPEDESKEDRFVRVANPRLVRSIKQLRNIAKMGNSPAYAYSEEQVATITEKLQNEVDNITVSLSPKTTKEVEDIL